MFGSTGWLSRWRWARGVAPAVFDILPIHAVCFAEELDDLETSMARLIERITNVCVAYGPAFFGAARPHDFNGGVFIVGDAFPVELLMKPMYLRVTKRHLV